MRDVPGDPRDDDVRAGGIACLLRQADAAVDSGHLESSCVRDVGDLLDDLRGELARGGEDERRRAALVSGDAVGDRDAEGERLARSGW
jgi:hypothetical protein